MRHGLLLTSSLFAIGAFAFSTSTPALADEGSGWNAYVGAGGIFYEGDDELESGGLYEGRVGYDFNTRWTLEGSVGGMPYLDNRDFDDDRFQLDDTVAGMKMGIHALYHLNGNVERRWDPYLSVNGQALYYSDEVHKHRNKWDGVAGGGAGVNYFLNDAWALRGDYEIIVPADSGEINHTGLFMVGYSWGRKAALAGKGASNEDSGFADDGMPKLVTIYFDFDRSLLTADSKAKLSELLEWMKKNPGKKVLLTGHCDERGTNEYNLALGDRRARAAFEYMITLGADKSLLSTISYGEERPADPAHNEGAWSKNRRVEAVEAK